MAAPASAATPIAATVPPAIANPSRPSFQETKGSDQKAGQHPEESENERKEKEIVSDPF